MSREWMPMYWGDYLRDTRHLTLEQHGAYLMLIAHYWSTGSLPSDKKALRQILGLNSEENRKRWESICLAIAPFFDEQWKHKRVERELEKHRVVSEKRAFAGRKGGLVSRGMNNNERFVAQAIAKQTGGIPQPHIDSSLTSDSEKGAPPQAANGSKRQVSSSLADTVRSKGWAP